MLGLFQTSSRWGQLSNRMHSLGDHALEDQQGAAEPLVLVLGRKLAQQLQAVAGLQQLREGLRAQLQAAEWVDGCAAALLHGSAECHC